MAWSKESRYRAQKKRLTSRWGKDEGEKKFADWVRRQENAEPRQVREKTPGAARSSRVAKENQVYTTLGFAIFGVDSLACLAIPSWEQERLTQYEIGSLAKAFGDEVLTSKKLTQYVLSAGKAGPHAKLAMALAAVAIPRMARRGMVPEILANAITNMESGGAHGDLGDDGIGEVGANEPAYDEDPSSLHSFQEQSGRHGVPGFDFDQESQADERPKASAGAASEVRGAA